MVNRFDLTPSDFSSCGEYRIVYAKLSGRSDPGDRALLILEASLNNPTRRLDACRPVTELWAALPSAAGPEARAEQLEALFFDGLGTTLLPVVHASHFGGSGECSYASNCGQIRVGQGMQEPWQFRQFRLFITNALEQGARLLVTPTTATGALKPAMFSESSAELTSTLQASAASLAAREVSRVHTLSNAEQEAGESAVTGLAAPDYEHRVSVAAGWPGISTTLQAELDRLELACPPDDPLTPASLVRRATAQSCAGCHAPERVVAPDRRVGCGMTWPATDGKTHIDEHGRLSSALVEVFLPHRANVLATYLQACAREAIVANLQPARRVLLK